MVDKLQADVEKVNKRGEEKECTDDEDDTDLLSSYASRAKLGRMCKRLIDFGRMHYIRTHLHMEARLVRFIDAAITPENVLLMAYQAINSP